MVHLQVSVGVYGQNTCRSTCQGQIASLLLSNRQQLIVALPSVRSLPQQRGPWGIQAGSVAAVLSSGGDEEPLYPEALNTLYLLYSFACFVERTWRFALPLVLAFMEGGYQAIAVVGFVAPLACSVFGPTLGRLLDRLSRPVGLGSMVALQGIAIGCSALLLLAGSSTILESKPLFLMLLVLSALERLSAMASELAIERDWVAQLVGREKASVLAKSNALLRRTDLSCELLGAIFFGYLYATFGLVPSVASAAVLAAVFTPLQLLCIQRMSKIAPQIVSHDRNKENNIKASGFVDRLRQQVEDGIASWRCYFKQPILPASLTFVLIFFNVAMSPGGLITAILTSWGFDGNAMAAFRGGCAVMGFTGTWVGGLLIRNFGLLKAGVCALAIQGTLLVSAAVLYTYRIAPGLDFAATIGNSIPIPVVVWAALVLLSRIGVWSFDMVNAQLFQQTVSPKEVAAASTAEMALCSFSELAMLGLAAYVIAPAARGALVYSSLAAVLVANFLYLSWALSRKQDFLEKLSLIS